MSGTELVTGPQVPVPDVARAVESMRAFQKLKTDLLEKTDTVTIGDKRYIKRSGWRKISLAFNISTGIVSVEREKTELGWSVRVRARAVAPGGRTAEEVAACDSEEMAKNNIPATLHNIESKAATRAINRAISDLVGGGEVSADELNTAVDEGQTQQAAGPVLCDRTQMLKFTWSVGHSDAPIEADSAPYGFLRNKVIQGLVDKHSITYDEDRVGEKHVSAVYVGGLPLDDQKDLVNALVWSLTKLNKCEKSEVRVFLDGKEYGAREASRA